MPKQKMKLSIILGTRPEIIKMSPIIRECERRGLDYFILHTGQHYSYNMDEVFFGQLELPAPKYNLDIGSGSHAQETGKMLIGIERILLREKPDIVLVEGDTNTVLAGALAASKLHVKVGHIEAGLRSYDKSMPEEINRILTDHISDYLFAPTQEAKDILLKEGISEDEIFVTGNTIVDAVYHNLKIANKRPSILEKLNLKPKNYFLVTLHRQENVDDRERFTEILRSLEQLARQFSLPVIYPLHPRSKRRMKEFGIKADYVKLLPPFDFLSFLQLESNAKLILTDSGGVQEESCILGVPCVTLRDSTERPETLTIGSNTLSGSNLQEILRSVESMVNRGDSWVNPFGDGKAGKIIIEILR